MVEGCRAGPVDPYPLLRGVLAHEGKGCGAPSGCRRWLEKEQQDRQTDKYRKRGLGGPGVSDGERQAIARFILSDGNGAGRG